MYNLFFLLTGDPGRETLDPDLLGEMVKIDWGSNLLNPEPGAVEYNKDSKLLHDLILGTKPWKS